MLVAAGVFRTGNVAKAKQPLNMALSVTPRVVSMAATDVKEAHALKSEENATQLDVFITPTDRNEVQVPNKLSTVVADE